MLACARLQQVTRRETISRRRWIVLNDHERKALREFERQFQDEDPRFTRSFEARQTRLARHPHNLGANLAVVAAMLLAAVTLLAGSLVGALAIVLTTGLIWVAWSRSACTDRRPS
jgi:Flp pilus assembly protein TadB